MSYMTVGIAGAILIAVLLVLLAICLAYQRRRVRTLLLMMELLKGYFRGDIPTDQLGQRTRDIASRHFLRSAEFYSLAIAAFQSAVDTKLAHQSHSIEEVEEESKLLRLLARLKREFGLTDRYQIEG